MSSQCQPIEWKGHWLCICPARMYLSRIHSVFVVQMMASGKWMATITWACIWRYPAQNWSVTPNTSRTHLHHCQVGSDRGYASLHCPLHPEVSWRPGAQGQALPSFMDPHPLKEWSRLIFTLLIYNCLTLQMPTNNITVTYVGGQLDGTLKAVPGWVLCSASPKFISLCPLPKRRDTTPSNHHLPHLSITSDTGLCHLITGVRLPTTSCRVHSLRTDVHNSSWTRMETVATPGPHCGICFCIPGRVIKTPEVLQRTMWSCMSK